MARDALFSGESKNIEYKITLPDKSEKYMKTIVAFANTQGGKLIVGIDDKTRDCGCGKRNIISVNGWNCQCYFRFLYAADYSRY